MIIKRICRMKSLITLLLASALLAPLVGFGAAEAMMKGAAVEEKEALPQGAKVVGIEVTPSAVKLNGAYDYTQLLVVAKLSTGDTADATRLATYKLGSKIGEVSASGQLGAVKN